MKQTWESEINSFDFDKQTFEENNVRRYIRIDHLFSSEYVTEKEPIGLFGAFFDARFLQKDRQKDTVEEKGNGYLLEVNSC